MVFWWKFEICWCLHAEKTNRSRTLFAAKMNSTKVSAVHQAFLYTKNNLQTNGTTFPNIRIIHSQQEASANFDLFSSVITSIARHSTHLNPFRLKQSNVLYVVGKFTPSFRHQFRRFHRFLNAYFWFLFTFYTERWYFSKTGPKK